MPTADMPMIRCVASTAEPAVAPEDSANAQGPTQRPAAARRYAGMLLRLADMLFCTVEYAANFPSLHSVHMQRTMTALPVCRKRVLSGVQPTGTLHLGNYFGAINNWVRLQDTYGTFPAATVLCFILLLRIGDCRVTSEKFPTLHAFRAADTFFMMADMHAITVPHDPKELLASTRSTTALYLACGIDPDRAAVFVQSHVSAHAELAWMLQCYTPIGWLRKMIQFKTKSEKQVGDHVMPGGHH